MTLFPEKSPGGAVAICRSPAPTGFCLYGDKARPWQYLRCVCDSGWAQLNSLPGRCQRIPCRNAGVAQLVEHELPKLGVAGSNPVARSSFPDKFIMRLINSLFDSQRVISASKRRGCAPPFLLMCLLPQQALTARLAISPTRCARYSPEA